MQQLIDRVVEIVPSLAAPITTQPYRVGEAIDYQCVAAQLMRARTGAERAFTDAELPLLKEAFERCETPAALVDRILAARAHAECAA